ncbi:MAG: thiamine-phosphate kinase [Holophaga sp.]|nr:thiamine-phosphate kinase [Holophaga sp.]
MRLSESEIIRRIRETFPGGEALTDDCGAVPQPPAGCRLLVTTDLMESEQHFRLDWHPPDLLGRKLLMVNLSDLDASGALPLGFTLTLALGPELEADWLVAFLDGLAEASKACRVPVIGGDTVGRPSGLGLGVTAFGAAKRWLNRSNMRPGDRIFVDQPLGRSLRGLRKLQAGQRWDALNPDEELAAHLDPKPNLGLGYRLAEIAEVHACMDLSDGLSKDLRMLAEASGCSVVLAKGLDSDQISGGEDFARCFASCLSREELELRLCVPLQEVGEAVSRREWPVLIYDGKALSPLPDQSFDHFARRTE